MAMLEDLVPLAGIAMIVAIVVGPIWIGAHFKSRERERMHATLRAMIDKGETVSPELLENLQTETAKRQTPEADLRRGVLWLAVGLAFYAMSWVIGPAAGEEASWGVAAIGVIPGFVGAGYILLWLLSRKRTA